MQLRYEQLTRQLNNKPLAPIYLISGDELLLVQTMCDLIRKQAKAQGFADREVFHAESGFDWHALLTRSNNYDLFSEKQLLELHLQNIPEPAAQMLKTYAANPPINKLLLIITGKLDRRLQQTVWFKTIDKVGIHVAIWPMEKSQLPSWINERLRHVGLKAEKEAIECLIFATEGNLLATAHVIEKLSLYLPLPSTQTITQAVMAQALSDNARFDPFKLSDAALAGEATRCLRILKSLKEEGVEPLLILWSLSRECRQLASFAFQQAQGKNLKTLFQTYSIWEKRQPLFQHALRRHSLSQWHRLLRFAAHSDHIIKGVKPANIWSTLQQLSLQLAGIKTL